MDVLKSNGQLILVNGLGRPLPGDDVTEKTAQNLLLKWRDICARIGVD